MKSISALTKNKNKQKYIIIMNKSKNSLLVSLLALIFTVSTHVALAGNTFITMSAQVGTNATCIVPTNQLATITYVTLTDPSVTVDVTTGSNTVTNFVGYLPLPILPTVAGPATITLDNLSGSATAICTLLIGAVPKTTVISH